MKILATSILIIIFLVGGYLSIVFFKKNDNTSDINSNGKTSKKAEDNLISSKNKSPNEYTDISENERGLEKSIGSNILETSRKDIINKLVSTMEADASFSISQSLYERSYDACNEQFNVVYEELFASQDDIVVRPDAECLTIKALLHEALNKSTNIEEKVILVEMLMRWEPMDIQLNFVRSHANSSPIITGVSLANLERNALYINSSLEAKSSVIDTFNNLSLGEKIENAHEFFQTFIPIVIEDVNQGISQYFTQLETVTESFPIPSIPNHNEEYNILNVIDKIPGIENEYDLEQWAENNPNQLREILSSFNSEESDQHFTGTLARLELALSLQGQYPSSENISNIIANEPNDAIVYHALKEIITLKNEGQYFSDYYNKIQQNDFVRARMDSLLKESKLNDGKHSSIEKIYVQIW